MPPASVEQDLPKQEYKYIYSIHLGLFSFRRIEFSFVMQCFFYLYSFLLHLVFIRHAVLLLSLLISPSSSFHSSCSASSIFTHFSFIRHAVLLLSLLISPSFVMQCFFYLYSFLLHVFASNIAPLQFWHSNITFPLTSTFRVIIITSSSVFLYTYPNHPSLAYLMFWLAFVPPPLALISSVLISSILLIALIHLNRFVYVLS